MASQTDNIPISEPLSSLHINDNKENQGIQQSQRGANSQSTEQQQSEPDKTLLAQHAVVKDQNGADDEYEHHEHHKHHQEVRYNELTTIKKCLLALKNVDGYRELFPFQYKLNQFIAEDKVKAFDSRTKQLLSECADIMHDIVNTLEEKGVKNTNDQVDGGGFTNVDDEVEIKRNRYHDFQEADYDIDSEAYGSESEPEGNDYY